MKQLTRHESPFTPLQGNIKEVRIESALFEFTICNCFLPDCTCQSIEFWLPKSVCKINKNEWLVGESTVKIPIWLFYKAVEKHSTLHLS